MQNISAVVLDIEGTTTSISFVYDELFPFARAQVEQFLLEHWSDESVQADVSAIARQADDDADAGVDGVVLIPAADDAERRQAVVRNVLWQMDNDRKTTGLKSLQGKIWTAGYASGSLKGHLFADVTPAIRAWNDAEIPVFIYSSGSVAAQKLLFGNSVDGDLRPLLAGYFDTTTGPKKEPGSYRLIAEAIGVPPVQVLFVTDNLAEAIAADDAGLQTRLSVRPGNSSLPEHPFEEIHSFGELV